MYTASPAPGKVDSRRMAMLVPADGGREGERECGKMRERDVFGKGR